MQSKKILVACLSLLLVALTLPSSSIPRAHAFLAANPGITVTGLALTAYTDAPNGVIAPSPVNVAAPGATINFNVVVFADNPTTAYQRNVTVGVKFDWMTAYQNATTASSTSTLIMTANQESSVTVSVSVLSTTAMIPHAWSILVGDGPQNKPIPSTCSGNINGAGNVCLIINGGEIQIWSNDQISAAQAKFQAGKQITNVDSELTVVRSILGGSTPGLTNAAGQLAQANTEISLGDQSWSNGDFSGAKSHYQNAANDANAAANALTGSGGGSDTASITNQILNGVGIAMFGVGALLAGIGGFLYLRRKPKA